MIRLTILTLLLGASTALAQERPWWERGSMSVGEVEVDYDDDDDDADTDTDADAENRQPTPSTENRQPTTDADTRAPTTDADTREPDADTEAEEGSEASVDATDTDVATDETWPLDLQPYGTIVGGFHYQDIRSRSVDDTRQDRLTTVAMTRIGLVARIHRNVSIVSELDLNAGPHGTSVWEGQAAIQVRNQLVRLEYGPLRVDAGRITDPASMDYVSAYMGNLLYTDPLARFPLLVSGFNRGNGVLVRVSPVEGLSLGVTVNAGNPTSTTGTVQIGGTFPPFSRFYEVPSSHVGRDARGFPADSFHALLVSPSVSYEHELFRAQLAMQWFSADTNTNSTSDEPIRGYNLRGGVQLRLWEDRIRPFFNLSRVTNDVIDPSDTGRLLQESYEGRTITGGVDVGIDGESGVGGQYSRVREQQGQGTVIIRHYWNLGGSYWIVPNLALDARAGFYVRCDDDDCRADGDFSYWLTLRGRFGQ